MRAASAVLLIVGSSIGVQEAALDPLCATFFQRVDAYVAMHRRLEGPLPPEVVTADPAALFQPRKALAHAIRRERAGAKQGEIFSPAVARYFRDLVGEGLRQGEVRDMLAIVRHENTVPLPARVNGDFPAGRSVVMMPPALLAALPALPPELQYRFVGRDLVLWDVHAGLIVDFVPAALADSR